MDTFGLKIIASDGVFYEGRCKKLIIPAPDGEKGILANHENMVIAVNVGVAHMSLDGDEWKDIAVGVGFVEIVNNRVTLIVDTAEKPEDIDVRRAQEQKERAEERLLSAAEYPAVLSYAGISGKSDEPTSCFTG